MKELNILEKESEIAFKWFHKSDIIFDPGKFQSFNINRLRKMGDSGDKPIPLTKSITLLGLQVDNILNFDLQVSILCKKVEVNALSKNNFFKSFSINKALVESLCILKI